jgi:hypothetical protein
MPPVTIDRKRHDFLDTFPFARFVFMQSQSFRAERALASELRSLFLKSFGEITPIIQREVEMRSTRNSAETSVGFLQGALRDRSTGFRNDGCHTLTTFEEDLPEAEEAILEVTPDEIDGFWRLASVARRRMGIISGTILALTLVAIAHGQDDAVTAAHATIQKVDSSAKTIVVKTDDGVGHTLRFLDSTAVHGGDAADVASKDSWHGLKEGGEVVVHYTKSGSEDTAVEIDKIGDGGLKATEGTVKEIDRGGKNLVVVAGDGTEQTFRLTGEAAKDTGAGIGKGSKVTVFYIGKAGKKIAHFLGTTSSGPY